MLRCFNQKIADGVWFHNNRRSSWVQLVDGKAAKPYCWMIAKQHSAASMALERPVISLDQRDLLRFLVVP